MKYKFLVWGVALLGIFLIGGCGGNEEDASRGNASPQNAMIDTKSFGVNPSEAPAGDIIEGRGSIIFLPFEGGFYGIVASDGARYDPANLAPEYHIDGLQVIFRVRLSEEQNSIHMWGQIVEIISIEKLLIQDK